MMERLRNLRPSNRPAFLMMPGWFATGVVDSLLFVLSVLEHHGCSVTAHKGLLLGAHRLGGLLPWDDDADVFLIDADAADVARRLGPVFREHGFVLQFRTREYYFFAFPRTVFPFAQSGLTELGLMTRTVDAGGAQYDAHEPRRRLADRELLPPRRTPFYGSWVPGPADPDVALERMYGSLASAEVMGRFKAPAVDAEVLTFWRAARPIDGTLNWAAVSRRFRARRGSAAFHIWQLPCTAWHLANRTYWIATSVVRGLAGGDRRD